MSMTEDDNYYLLDSRLWKSSLIDDEVGLEKTAQEISCESPVGIDRVNGPRSRDWRWEE